MPCRYCQSLISIARLDFLEIAPPNVRNGSMIEQCHCQQECELILRCQRVLPWLRVPGLPAYDPFIQIREVML